MTYLKQSLYILIANIFFVFMRNFNLINNRNKKIVARFRYSNGELSNRFWCEQEEENNWLCHNVTETLDHLATNCIAKI